MTGSGVKYPTLSIGGKAYELRLSLGAFYRLEQDGLPADKLAAEIQSWIPEVDAAGTVTRPGKVSVVTLLQVLAACIGNQTTMTAAQIADHLEMSDLQEVAAAVAQACAISMSKLQPTAAIKLQEPAATQELQ